MMADNIVLWAFVATLFGVMFAVASNLVYVGRWIGKVDTKLENIEKNASRLEDLIKDRPSRLEMRTLLYSAIALGKSSPEATEPASATVTPKRKAIESSEDTKVPPRTRTP